jgi:hypothetical protein
MESRPTPVLSAPEAETVSERDAQPVQELAPEPALSLAEDLPTLYRAILDRVALLEHIGERHEAGQIRADATQVYSVAWNGSARVRLTSLLLRADRLLAGPNRGRGWIHRRRAARAR